MVFGFQTKYESIAVESAALMGMSVTRKLKTRKEAIKDQHTELKPGAFEGVWCSASLPAACS